ncbi:MAG: hypothetical protein ACRCYX_05480 [Dermatophilaceae bacterium]
MKFTGPMIAVTTATMTLSLVSTAPADARSRPPGFACWADEQATTWTDQRQIVQGTADISVFVDISTYPDPADVYAVCVFPENSAGTVRIVADPGNITLGEVPLQNQLGQGPPRGMRFTGAGDVSVASLAPGVYTIHTDYGIDQAPTGVSLTVTAPAPPPPPAPSPTPLPPRPCSIYQPPGCPS